MTVKLVVTSVHMDHEGGTKEYLLDHIRITDTEQGGNNVVVNHSIMRWGGVGKKRQCKIEHDPMLTRLDAIRSSKVKRGYQAPSGRNVVEYPSLDRFATAHWPLWEVLTSHEIVPPSVADRLAPGMERAPEPEPDFYIPPAGSTSATDLNPNLGIF